MALNRSVIWNCCASGTRRHLEAFAPSNADLVGVTVDVLLIPSVEFSGMAARADVFKVREHFY